ncbi:MAG: HlyD family efflux transporter periplasmic adaptor subunit, partial [Candidatus Absconditabacteria bacterium]
YQKLFVKAPISGKIAKIFVDKGQDVGMGTPLIQVVNSSQPEISVSFNSNEINYITLNDEVTFEYENNIYTGNVISIGNVADQNLNYTVKVGIKETITRIGDFVKVDFTFKSDKIILPLNYSYIEGNGKGYIFILTGENFERLPVTFGKTWLDRIEILSEIDENLEMITSDIKNFDNRKFNIVIQK